MGSKRKRDDVVRRIDATRVRIENRWGVPITLFANHKIPIDAGAVEQLLEFVSLQETLDLLAERQRAGRIATFWGEAVGVIASVVVTPDFHRGSGIPIGTVVDARGLVIPRAVGNDICCGMRLLVTDLTRDEIEPALDRLAVPLRASFFEGKRDIPMSPRQRESLLREGLPGLLATYGDNASTGVWGSYDPREQEADLERVHFGGSLTARGTFAFDDFIRASGARDARDCQLGSVGGGNHFVEIQTVEELFDGATAHEWGLKREAVTIMAHSGSVGLGHVVGSYFDDRARAIFPKELRHPEHGFYAIPAQGPHAKLAASYLDALHNAANFAFGNRLMLGLMALRVLSDAVGRRVGSRLVYDAPHNLVWEPAAGSGSYLHRKGACPAPGPEPETSGPFRYTGHPVIIPGSMGSSSFVLAGSGNVDALESACHGAGRVLARGKARHVNDEAYRAAVSRLRVVTPLDPNSVAVRSRRDVLGQYHGRLKEEAPYAYKPITPVVETVEEAGIAHHVARLWPLLTIKG